MGSVYAEHVSGDFFANRSKGKGQTARGESEGSKGGRERHKNVISFRAPNNDNNNSRRNGNGNGNNLPLMSSCVHTSVQNQKLLLQIISQQHPACSCSCSCSSSSPSSSCTSSAPAHTHEKVFLGAVLDIAYDA